jgi:hypothetical protein
MQPFLRLSPKSKSTTLTPHLSFFSTNDKQQRHVFSYLSTKRALAADFLLLPCPRNSPQCCTSSNAPSSQKERRPDKSATTPLLPLAFHALTSTLLLLLNKRTSKREKEKAINMLLRLAAGHSSSRSDSQCAATSAGLRLRIGKKAVSE